MIRKGMQTINDKKKTKLAAIIVILLIFITFVGGVILNNSMQSNNISKMEETASTKLRGATAYSGLKLTTTPVANLAVGNKVKVRITTEGSGVCGIETVINYDKDIFEEITESDISFMYNWELSGFEEDDNGTWVSMTHKQGQVCDTGDLVEITFTVKTATDATTVGLTEIELVAEINGVAKPCTQSEITECQVGTPAVYYDIKYYKNTTDTVTNMPSDANVLGGSSYTIGSAPSRAGYRFKGWNTQTSGNGTNYTAGDKITVSADLDLYAKWEVITSKLTVNADGGTWGNSTYPQTYTQNMGTTKTIDNPTVPAGNKITYNANGGTVNRSQDTQTTTFSGWTGTGTSNLSGTTYTFGDTDKTLKASYTTSTVTLPTPTRTGYNFIGWYNSSGSSVGLGGASYTPEYTTPNATIALTAQWDAIQYTLTIKPNGGKYNGSADDSTVQGTYNSTKTLSTPIKTGYVITLNNEGTQNTQTQTYTFTGWGTPTAGTVSGSTYTFAASNATITANYTADTMTLTTPTRTGYTFDGWYTAQTGGSKINNPNSYMPTSDTTLYARWTAKTITVTFNPGTGATVNPTSRQVTYGSTYGTLPTPEKAGSDFTGWYTAQTGGTEIKSDTTVNTENDITLYARWSEAQYTLTIDADGGTYSGNTTVQGTYNSTTTLSTPAKTGYVITLNNEGATSTQTQTMTFNGWTATAGTVSGSTYTFAASNATITANYTADTMTLPEPTKVGYDFNGWYTAQTGGSKVNNPYTPTSNTTLYAQFTPKTFTITFSTGNTATVDMATKTVTYDSTYGTLAEVSNIPAGYNFKGWYLTTIGGVKLESTTIVKIVDDTTLYAQWEPIEYTLTIDADGGTYPGNTSVQGMYNSTKSLSNPTKTGYVVTFDNEGTTTTETQTYTFTGWGTPTYGTISGSIYTFDAHDASIKANYTADTMTLPTPATKTGYTFSGWYDLPTGGTQQVSPYEPTEDTTLYAAWTPKTVTVTFDAGTGGTVTPTTMQVTYDSAYGVLPEPTKDGSSFTGWYTSQTGGRKVESDTIVDTENDITLYARWSITQYTLTIDANEGTYSGNTTIQGEMGETITLSAPTKTGYVVTLENEGTTSTETQVVTFSGWTSTVGTVDNTLNTYTFGAGDDTITASYTLGQIALPEPTKTGYDFDGWYTSQTEGTQVTSPYTPTADITLYARWTAKTITVTFDAGTGVIATPAAIQATYDSAYGTLATVSNIPAGYEFDGWYTSETGGRKIESTTIVDTEDDITLYAHWVGAEYTVEFDYNGGTGAVSSTTVRNGATYGTLPTPDTRTGYEFKGWFTDPTAGTEITSTTTANLTADITLYAHWEAIETKLTVDPNGGIWGGNTSSEDFTQSYGTTKTIANPEHADVIITLDGNGGTPDLSSLTVTVSFDGWELANGGTFDSDTSVYTYGLNDGSLTAKWAYGNVTLPGASKERSIFLGWAASASATTADFNENQACTSQENITLYAIYDEAEFNLTIDPNGGTYNGSASTTTIQGINEEEITLLNPEKQGATITFNNNGTTTTETQTYSFEWVATAGTISGNVYKFEASDATVTANYTPIAITVQKPDDIDGYDFIGWNTEEDGSGVNLEDGDSFTTEQDVILYAQWRAKTFTLTFDYDGGNGEVENTTITYNEQYGELPTATKEGHTFIGWYDENENKIESTDIVDVLDDITLKAKYEINAYFITFKNADGTEIKTIKVLYGTDATFTGDLPTTTTNPGYEAIFTGWDNESALREVKEDASVQAVFNIQPIVYTITYYNLKEMDNSENAVEYTIEDEDITLVNLQNKGKYIFLGWYSSNEPDAEKITSIDTSELGNIVLYAKWENDELYMSSLKYKVGEKDIDNHEEGDIYLDKIEPNTTVKKLIENIDTNGTVVVIDQDGKILEENDIVGTRMNIKITRYDEQINLRAVVMGDLDGDGIVTATDLSALNQTVLNKSSLLEPLFKAADLDDNIKLTATDLSTINNTILKTIKLTYNKKK